MKRIAALLLLLAACSEPTAPREELVATEGAQTLSRIAFGRTETLILRENGRLLGVTKVTRNALGVTVAVTPVGKPTVTRVLTSAQLALAPDLSSAPSAQGDVVPPWGCGWIGRSLLFSVATLIISTATGNPLAVFLASLSLANNVSMYASCKEWYANNSGAP